VGVDGRYLYEDELLAVMLPEFSAEDSAEFVERYIRNWVSEWLLYQNARRNIPETKDIEELVESYREALILQRYEQRLMEQKLSAEISEDEIQSFYEENKSLFVLNESVIKGLLLKIPLSAPNLNRIRELYRKTDGESLDEIEKYGVRYAVRYESFYDSWTPVTDIQSILPQLNQPLDRLLEQNTALETKDDKFVYFLNVSEFIPRGSAKPMDQARPQIQELLMNSREAGFMQRIKEELYDNAVSSGRITFFNGNQE